MTEDEKNWKLEADLQKPIGPFCLDVDGNRIYAGDTVKYYSFIGCSDYVGEGKIREIGDMNEVQTNMPYIVDKGAWNPRAIRKVMWAT